MTTTMRAFETRPAESFGLREVLYSKDDCVGRLTLTRPQNYN